MKHFLIALGRISVQHISNLEDFQMIKWLQVGLGGCATLSTAKVVFSVNIKFKEKQNTGVSKVWFQECPGGRRTPNPP